MMSKVSMWLLASAAVLLSACGGGGSSPGPHVASDVAPITPAASTPDASGVIPNVPANPANPPSAPDLDSGTQQPSDVPSQPNAGGGAATGTSGSSAGTANKVTFSPSSWAGSTIEGVSTKVRVTAAFEGDFGRVYALLQDSTGILNANSLNLAWQSDGTIFATALTSSSLSAGVYSGALVLHLCIDSACLKEYAGSPWSLPYRVVVQPEKNITPLSAVSGLTDWAMLGGGAGRSSFVPMTVNPEKISTRWRKLVSRPIQSVVTAKGNVIAMTRYVLSSDGRLVAFREFDGEEAWSKLPAFTAYAQDQMVLYNGKVIVSASSLDQPLDTSSTRLWALDAKNGQEVYKTDWFVLATSRDLGVFVNEGVILASSQFGFHPRFDASTGATLPYLVDTSIMDSSPYTWGPAANADAIFSFRINGLAIGVKNTGSVISVVENSVQSDDFVTGYASVPVVSSDEGVISVSSRGWSPNTLSRYDVKRSKVSWTQRGNFASNAAVANGVVYVAQSAPFTVEARDEKNGGLLWSWVEPADKEYPGNKNGVPSINLAASSLVVTNNVLFVSSGLAVYALDLRSHQIIWSYPRPGNLSISSNGVLYIAPIQARYTYFPWGDGEFPGESYSLVAVNLH